LVAVSAAVRAALVADEDSPEDKGSASPPLQFADVRFGFDQVGSGLQEVAEAARDRGVLPAAEAGRLWSITAEGERVRDLTRAWFEGPSSFQSLCGELNLDPDLATLGFEVAAKPFVAAAAAGLALPADQSRERSACPACEGSPDFAYLDMDVGERNLVCWRCETAWPYRRIGCPYCGSTDPAKLSYAQTEDHAFRVYLCEECRGYLKTVDLRSAGAGLPLYEQRLRSWTLDHIAAEGGYRPQ
jgi:FdhE protein